jgi:hypothetical protein
VVVGHSIGVGNQTPLNIRPANRQSFFPSIAVAADGTIGVSYYDFRFNNNRNPATDRWLVQCHSSSTNLPSDSACWVSEIRLTDSSFNMAAVVPMVSGDFFFGDYFGLATAGDVATFAQPDNQNVTSIFVRRVGPAYAGDPTLNGTGSDPMVGQKTKQCLPLGAHCSKGTECCSFVCGDLTGAGHLNHFVCF